MVTACSYKRYLFFLPMASPKKKALIFLVENSVDVYVDDLQRFGFRMEARTSDMFFHVKLIESFPPSIDNGY